MKKKILAIQTARAGSKSVKKKNLIKVNGYPIFLHILKSAIDCKIIDKVVCSIDDNKIVPFKQDTFFEIDDNWQIDAVKKMAKSFKVEI